MTERRVTAVEELDLPEIDYVGLSRHASAQSIDPDPFAKKGEDVKSYTGVDATFKRRVSTQINKYHRGSDGTGSKKIEHQTVTGYNAFDVVAPPYNLDYLAKLYEVSAPHKAAVDAKVSNIVGLGYDFKETAKTKRTFEQLAEKGNEQKLRRARRLLDTHKEELLEALDSFNEEDTFSETLQKVWKDYETTGNGYFEVSRKKNGTIGYVGHISATTLRIRKQRDGFVQIISNKAVFFRNFGDRTTSNPLGGDNNPNEIIHLKKYSPTSAFYGIPDVIAAQKAIAGDEFSARFNLDYFENKAVPRHVIILKGAKLGTAAEQNLLQFFETGLKGQNHRTLYVPLPGDTKDSKVSLDIEAVEAGVQDSSFNNYKKQNLNEVLMVHRVPISKIGLAEGVSLAVARDADKTFKEQVCAPEQRIAEKKINRLVRELTDAFELKLNEMTLTDADTQSKIDERHIKNQIRTPNEIRADRGWPGIKGGDKVVELKPQQAADARAQGNRERDAQRSANGTDSNGEGRNAQGEGRAQA